MNKGLPQKRLATLASYPELNSSAVTKLGDVLRGVSPLSRIYEAAPSTSLCGFVFWCLSGKGGSERRQHVITPLPLIHAAKVGIFDFTWSLPCPGCGILLDSQATLNELEGDDFHCALCHVDDPTHLDDQVEVAFTINPALEEPDINPSRDVASYWRFFMLRDFIRSKQLTSYVDEVSGANELIEPDGSSYSAFEAEPTKLYRLMSPENHLACFSYRLPVPSRWLIIGGTHVEDACRTGR